MRTIPLTQGKVALVDDEDYERVVALNWHAVRAESRLWYVMTNIRTERGRKKVRLQNFILNTETLVDHHDGDGLNNRRRNLRACSHAQNMRNRKPNKERRFKGVWRAGSTFRAVIQMGDKRVSLGRFRNEEDGARAYDAKALELFGEFARLNFPQGVSSE